MANRGNKSNNKTAGNRNSRFRSSNNKPNNQRSRKINSSKGGIKKRPNKSKFNQDVRQKILQKKRRSVKDAREILANMARTKDVRTKLDRMRQDRTNVPTANGNVRPIGTNILKKVDRNGKISLVTVKSKAAADMNLAIQKQLGLISPPRPTIKKSPLKRQIPVVRKEPYAIKAVMDDYEPPHHHAARSYDSALYKWTKPNIRTAASQMIGSLEARRHALDEHLLSEDRWRFSITRPREYIDLDSIDDEEMPLVPVRQTISLQGSSRVSNVHSRLDTSPPQPETHGILSQPKTKVVVPAGHRIVVSNLQATVSQDDIKELFEDIGQLLAARLVRPGVAEVIYKNLKDAQKAVDTYHNRQLDGQPMKCLLVNKRPLNNPTAPPLTKSESQGLLTRKPVPTPNVTNKLVPDIQTIHKVLFQRK